MNKLYALFPALIITATLSAQSFCDPQGNVVIYSNYDGGEMVINVDQNIPNLKIGILSYEFSRIEITGQYAANVTQLWWVGYNGNNDNCNIGAPFYTTITGVPNSVDSIIQYPAATYTNPNGYGSMICNYTCSITTNQGGCNTADQTAHYFLTNFSGTLLFHRTGYNCWPDTVDISFGGNCCANPLTSIDESSATLFSLAPNPAGNSVTMLLPSSTEIRNAQITNLLGETVREIQIAAGTTSQQVSLEGLAPGTYFFRMQSGENSTTEKLVISE